jgi:hypothetical protein
MNAMASMKLCQKEMVQPFRNANARNVTFRINVIKVTTEFNDAILWLISFLFLQHFVGVCKGTRDKTRLDLVKEELVRRK